MELATIHVGERLGLYRALAEAGPLTASGLAARTHTDARYVREWLEQQAAAGLLACPEGEADAAPGERRFSLPAGHDEALLDPHSLAGIAGLVRLEMGILSTVPRLIEAFRTGEGIPYPDFGEDTREGIAGVNRPLFVYGLGDWIEELPDVHARLSRPPAARVADVACGMGWSTLALARAYPLAHVHGFDVDAASIARARENAAEAGLEDRVTFHVHDAADPSLAGSWELVTIFEALHDMAHPVEALRAARHMLAEGGCVLVGDELTAEAFTAPADPLERFMYGFSVLHCLPVGREDEHSAGTGTVIRPHTVRAYATEAGYREVTVLPIEHDFWRFYRLDP
jgi:SAM-dependent methyltransferase